MSYAAIHAGLLEAFRRDLTAYGVRAFLDGEPAAIQAYPTLYLYFDGSRVNSAGQRSARRWRTVARIVVARQDVRQDEPTIAPLVDAIIASVEVDPTLGGAVASGYASVIEQRAGWTEIGGVLYRAVDTTIETPEKVPYGT